MAVASGLLQVLPFPIAGPTPLWRTHLCWVALLPLIWALLDEDRDGRPLRRRHGAALGYASGFFWYLGNCYWIYQTMHIYGGLPEPVAAAILTLFCLYLGLYHALFGAVFVSLTASRLGRQGSLLLLPFLWVAVELLRARITGFPWDLLGGTQVGNPLLHRLAPWTGAFGLSFVIAAVNALWLLRLQIRERRWTRPVLALAGVVVIACYVLVEIRPTTPQRVSERGTATLLQENLEVGAEGHGHEESASQLLESFAALSRLPSSELLLGTPETKGVPSSRRAKLQLQVPDGASLQGAYEKSDIVLWPESPAPFEERSEQFRSAMSGFARQVHAPLIVGNIGIDQTLDPAVQRGYNLYNSASFIDAHGYLAGRYDKMHLVPFGEYVPYRRLFFFAGNLLAEVGTFEPGVKRGLFATGGHRYGTFICYESIFGDEIREFSKMGADVLVNLSNDGWYGDTSAPWQHLDMVRMRAIENHRWVLRATNTGVTAAIDPEGRVVEAAPRHVRTAIRVDFGYEHDLTFYAAHGDWFAWGCLFITASAVCFGEWSRRTQWAGWRVVRPAGARERRLE